MSCWGHFPMNLTEDFYGEPLGSLFSLTGNGADCAFDGVEEEKACYDSGRS